MRLVKVQTLCLMLICIAGVAFSNDDPFADVQPRPASEPFEKEARYSWKDNLLFRREIYALFGSNARGSMREENIASRVSAGFEVQKLFASPTRTFGSFDYQGRMVYRESMPETAFDPMGHDTRRWKYETHNAYINLLDLAGEPGRFNLRLGYYYLPFGLNQQTDTHGTLLQLSNHRVFGTAHDWQASAYGSLNDDLDYTLAYVLGTGPDHSTHSQAGLGFARLSLNNNWLFNHNLEAGLSLAAGERINEHFGVNDGLETMRGEMEAKTRTWRGP